MKKILSIFLVVLQIVVCSAEQDGKLLLQKAFKASETASYSAKYLNTNNEIISFSRLYDQERGVLKKGSFLKIIPRGSEYQFYQLPEGFFSAKGTLVHPLACAMLLKTPDDLYRMITESNWNAASYLVDEIQFKGHYAYKITMTSSEKYLSEAHQEIESMSSRINDRYPVVRVFIVLEKNFLIVSRKHYNNEKELVYSLEYQEVDIATPLQFEDFALPGKPDSNYFLTEKEAITFDAIAESELEEQAQAAKVAQTKRDNFFKKLFRGGITPLVWCILGISVLCVVFGLCWKRFAKR